MPENYLTFEHYRQVCAENGETDAKAQESLAFYLHSLGIVLNYKDDPRLRYTHVLNPHWVTNGIYKILNSQRLADQQGELRVDDLVDILDTEEYPSEMHGFLFDLMKKFELCFSFPEDDSRYLIPELLDKEEPESIKEFQLDECLNFQYDYPVLPEGLLPRFIVRMHALSTGMPRWRTGVVLEFEGCRALVKADVQDKRVFISIQGPPENRRRLLAVIRSDFERIHATIEKLQPVGIVPVPGNPGVTVSYKELLVMEQHGMGSFPKVAGNEVITLDVQKLLNGVDLEGAREKHDGPARLFYSYSHKDEDMRDELDAHLKILEHRGLITSLHDRKIEAGEDWRKKTDENLESADIILLLVSASFIASPYCYAIEMTRALERHRAAEARVIPVIIRDVNWSHAPFASLEALPKSGLAVELWPHRNSAWRDVSEGIEQLVNQIRLQRSGEPLAVGTEAEDR
jgi:internalin A